MRLRPGYFPFTEPSVEVDVSCFHCGGTGYLRDGSRCPLCKGEGWIEILGSGMVDPNVLGYVAEQRLRPRAGPGLRLRDGHRADRDARHGVPDLRMLFENDLRLLEQFGAGREGPGAWLRSYCDPGTAARRRWPTRLTMTGVKLERLDHVGVGDDGGFVVGKVLAAEPHPDADRLSVCIVDDGSGEPRTIVCGAPNVAAGQTVAVARPGAVMPDGTQARRGEAARRQARAG